jgi:NAD+-dependent secondary alcohol dehydrogenase Adh1
VRAALLTDYHKDFQVDTVPDPEITAADDVIVRVGAAGFCRTDIHIWDGQFDQMWQGAGIGLPFICGHENAGWIAEVGPGVPHLSVGQPVLLHGVASCGYCHFCRAGEDMHCTASSFPGIFAPGGFAEYVRTNARAVIPLPENLTPVDVAPLGDAGITAYHAVKKAVPYAVPGSYTVVLGAGGLGHIGIQALRAMTATEIIVVDRNPAALEHARGWGADHTVQTREDRSHVAEVRDLTEGAGAQVVIDYVGEGGAERDAVELLAPKGVDFLVGYGGTLQVKILEEGLFPETSFVSCIVGPYNELVELVKLTAKGHVRLTSTTFPLEGVNEALHALDEGRIIGRGVLVPNES